MSRLYPAMCLVFILATAPLVAAETAVAPPPPVAATAAPQPAATTSINDALVVIVAGDLQGLITQFGQLASQSRPDLSGDSLKQMFGAQLGDPELKGMPPGAGIVGAFFSNGAQVMMLEVAAESAEPYKNLLTSRGSMAEVVDGLLISSRNQIGMDTARAASAEVKAMLQGAGNPTVDLRINMKQIVQLYGPTMQFMIQQMTSSMSQGATPGATPGQPDMQSAKKMVEAQMRALMAIAQQIDKVNAILSFSAEGASFEKIITPTAGSDLAKLAAAPTVPGDTLAPLVPQSGAIRGFVMFNGQALGALLRNAIAAVTAQMTIDPAALAAINELFTSMDALQGEGFSALMPGEKVGSGIALYKTASPEAAQQMLASWLNIFKADAVKNFYASMGMPVTITVTDKARDYAGTPIAQMTVDMPATQGIPPGTFPMNYEMAAVNDMVVLAMGSTSLDKQIDFIKATDRVSAPLRAQSVMPAGGDAYIDVSAGDLVAMIEQYAQAAGQTQMPKVGQALQGAQPITISADMAGDTIRGRMLVPADVVNKIVQAAQNQGAAAAPMAPTTPEAPAPTAVAPTPAAATPMAPQMTPAAPAMTPMAPTPTPAQ